MNTYHANLKKGAALILVFALVCSLFGCFSNETEPTDATSSATSDATSSATGQVERPTSGGVDPSTLTGDGTKAFEHDVLGSGKGINPGRVTWAHRPGVFDWAGDGYWWNTANFDIDAVKEMFSDSLCALTGKQTDKEAWDALFRYTDAARGVSQGYKSGDGIAIKINMNGCNSLDGGTNILFTSPVMLKVLLESIIDAGVKAEDITVFDCTRVIPTAMVRYCQAGSARRVNFRFNSSEKRNECVASDHPIEWSSDEVNGEASFLPDFVVEAKYFINLSGMKGHDLAGVTAMGKNLFGSLINSNRSAAPWLAGLHPLVAALYYSDEWPGRDMATYSPIVDLLASADMGQKTVLYISEAFISTPKQNSEVKSSYSKWTMSPFNKNWPSSLFLSQDPVAIDTVCGDFLSAERNVKPPHGDIDLATQGTWQNYLHEAALIGNPPSGTAYKDGHGNVISGSLGVHEHWNNAEDKQYSRNLGKSEGIELYRISYN